MQSRHRTYSLLCLRPSNARHPSNGQRRPLDCQQTVEDVAVSPQGQPQLFGVGLTVAPLPRKVLALFLEDGGEVLQHVADEAVGLLDRVPGVVDEALLDHLPMGPEMHDCVVGDQVVAARRSGFTRGPSRRGRSGVGGRVGPRVVVGCGHACSRSSSSLGLAPVRYRSCAAVRRQVGGRR